MKPRRRALLVLAGCTAVAAIIFLAWPSERGPVSRGHRLTYWLVQYRALDNHDPKRKLEIEDAVREMGTSAIPTLLELLKETRPFNPPLDYRIFGEDDPDTLDWPATLAIHGFTILGPEGRTAVPALAVLAKSTNFESATDALEALSQLGREGLPPLLEIATNAPTRVSVAAIQFLSMLGTNAAPAAPVPVTLLAETNPPEIAQAAADALAFCRAAPDSAVPALANALARNDTMLTLKAMRALTKFGPLARPALPALTAVLNDTNPYVRQQATNAILDLAPDLPDHPQSK